MEKKMKKNNVWNTFTTGKKIFMIIWCTLNTVTLCVPDFLVDLLLMPMALMTAYKHYEGVERLREGFKVIGRFIRHRLVAMITLGFGNWYTIFGDFQTVYQLIRDDKNEALYIIEDVDFED